MNKHNFSAGPSILPQEVFQKSSQAILDYNGIGLSILEISHRSKEFIAIMEEAKSLVKKITKLGDEYEVLFLQGGASLQFVMTVMNLSKYGQKTAYLDTGSWSSKAIKEGKLLSEVVVVASSKDKNHNYIPKGYTIPSDAAFLHCTSNNTIFGTQIKDFPNTEIPLVCDMSSDIFSRDIDYSKFGLIYAGAQKNMGPAGATLVIVKKDLLGKSGREIPSYLDYSIHANSKSMFNTPPVFSTYVSYLTLQWLDNLGGISEIEKLNNAKSELLYNEIDTNPLFEGVAVKEDRSVMNATFVLKDELLKDKFDALLADKNISALGGHRSVGGYRASMYNAMSIDSVQVLVDAMQELNK
jgi:phosphoserine aminotransferase